jgi:hypothetical protein
MLTIELGSYHASRGHTRYECASALGMTAKEARKGAIASLCRMLVAAGVVDQPWQAMRGKVVLHGASIARLAQFDCRETSHGAPEWRRYMPFADRWSGDLCPSEEAEVEEPPGA